MALHHKHRPPIHMRVVRCLCFIVSSRPLYVWESICLMNAIASSDVLAVNSGEVRDIMQSMHSMFCYKCGATPSRQHQDPSSQ